MELSEYINLWMDVDMFVTLLVDVICMYSGVCLIRLTGSLGRRSVNLLPVAERTNDFANGVVDRPWVVGREFEYHVHHENAF